ncbi:MAG: radical SAM protein [Phycisphaerae bacterium]|jgi:uncharacterized radical SAM superfamily Fe-S cluster-containing enzyme|nr:radical SAM protein [Phycisphaerae bacterium]HPC21222.1 radical SAM protein [Phycisphaerae bacterium]HRS27320.1 radical SAM protein [Phycisphaerae bacterium]
MEQANRAFCKHCRTLVPCEHVKHDGHVYLLKHCPTCGDNESMVASDEARWQRKRDFWGYEDPKKNCNLRCTECRKPHNPTIVLIDITNRCNMGCPICIANIRGMGFEYNPPLAYFEKIFQALCHLDPKPLVQLIGGEPTVRHDLLDMVKLGRTYGLKMSVITNGLRLADEEYCKELCEARVRLRFGLDGRSPEIYGCMRGGPGACEKKLKGLANLAKYSRIKHTILCCAARGINDKWIADLVECCHENNRVIEQLALLPLAETWEEGRFKTQVQTTREDAEAMVEESIPGGQVEFVPAGFIQELRPLYTFLTGRSTSESLMFAGVHPDCETMTLLASDGQRYVSINHFLKMPFSRVAQEVFKRAKQTQPIVARLNPASRIDRWRAKWLAARMFLPLVVRGLAIRKAFRGNPVVVLLKFLGGLLRGRRAGDLARQYFNLSRILRVAVIPFEEYHEIDAARIENCRSCYAYEDVSDGQIKMIPACSWTSTYRDEMIRKVAAKYGTVPVTKPGTIAVQPPEKAACASKCELTPA